MNHTTAGVPDTQPTIRRWWMVAIACSAIVVAACSGAAAGPTEVVEAYIDIYNAGDIDELTEVSAEDAVLSGHPFAPEAEGIDAILSIQRSDRASAAEEAPYEISNVQATDNTVDTDVDRLLVDTSRQRHRPVSSATKALTKVCGSCPDVALRKKSAVTGWSQTLTANSRTTHEDS